MKESQLNRFRSRLLELRERLTNSIDRMSETVLTDAQPPEEHDRQVSESSEKELVLEHDEETIRRQVMKALERVDRGDYGICQECGKSIGLERLEVVPYTPYCVGCEQQVEAS
jgi:DnaK suppressor protein